MIQRIAYLLLVALFAGFTACSEPEQPPGHQLTPAELRAAMDSLDRLRAGVEKQEILSFLDKKQWPVTNAKSGVWYWVYEQGESDSIYPEEGDVVNVRYEIRLLNDTLCYTNKQDEETEQFTVNLDNIESGVHEGITYMRVGDKAKLIMPSFRAHGLLGDMDMIPPSSPIVFDIELVGLRKANGQ